jgi:peroxiredoxin Q/BCP
MKNITKFGYSVPALFLSASLPILAALEEGAMAPDFTAPASLDGKEFTYSLADVRAEGPVVVYFYPSAYTQGCNIQAHTFAINMSKFRAAGGSVVGVSLDSIDRLNDFSADPEYCAGELPVVSDVDGSIAASYNISVRGNMLGFKDSRGNDIDHGFAERTTFIVDEDGKVVATIGGVAPDENVMQSLAVIETLQK